MVVHHFFMCRELFSYTFTTYLYHKIKIKQSGMFLSQYKYNTHINHTWNCFTRTTAASKVMKHRLKQNLGRPTACGSRGMKFRLAYICSTVETSVYYTFWSPWFRILLGSSYTLSRYTLLEILPSNSEGNAFVHFFARNLPSIFEGIASKNWSWKCFRFWEFCLCWKLCLHNDFKN